MIVHLPMLQNKLNDMCQVVIPSSQHLQLSHEVPRHVSIFDSPTSPLNFTRPRFLSTGTDGPVVKYVSELKLRKYSTKGTYGGGLMPIDMSNCDPKESVGVSGQRRCADPKQVTEKEGGGIPGIASADP